MLNRQRCGTAGAVASLAARGHRVRCSAKVTISLSIDYRERFSTRPTSPSERPASFDTRFVLLGRSRGLPDLAGCCNSGAALVKVYRMSIDLLDINSEPQSRQPGTDATDDLYRIDGEDNAPRRARRGITSGPLKSARPNSGQLAPSPSCAPLTPAW